MPEKDDAPLAFHVRGLTKTYGAGESKVYALRGVDLDVPRGELVVLLGQSGSGKSEIAKLLFYDLQRKSKDNRAKSLIVIEPHGDLSEEVAAFCLNRGKYKERLLLNLAGSQFMVRLLD